MPWGLWAQTRVLCRWGRVQPLSPKLWASREMLGLLFPFVSALEVLAVLRSQNKCIHIKHLPIQILLIF